MITYKLKVINNLGLHVRVCSKLVACAGRYSSNITFTFNEHTVDAKSIIGLMSLGAGLGSEIILNVDGEDELQAVEAIKALFANGFEELT